MSQSYIISAIRALQWECLNRGIDHLSLFGSYARNDFTQDSDVDLLYERNASNTLDLVWYETIQAMIQQKIGKKIDLIYKHAMHPVLLQEASSTMISIF